MNANTSLWVSRLLPFCFSFLFCITLHSQGVDPSSWQKFVTGKENDSLTDTFRLQTFNQALSDNWAYQTTGNTPLFDPREEGILDSSDGQSIMLTPGSYLYMDTIEHKGYDNIKIHVKYAAWRLMTGENLLLNTDRGETSLNNYLWLTPPDNYSASFTQKKDKSASPNASKILILNNPRNLTLWVETATHESQQGFYAIDSVAALGATKIHSLFTQKGHWHEGNLWSHAPALRQRRALINGDVYIDRPTSCARINLGNGSIHINEGQSLSAQTLLFHPADPALYSSGDIHLNKCIVYQTFPEKGKWYFISFPFDVYKNGLDVNFQLKDQTFKGEGNYFYLQTYDGEKRAIKNEASGNWQIVSSDILKSNRPVFEKNKGYLIALDKKAKSQTLYFSSANGDIPLDFARKAVLSLSVTEKTKENQEQHHGWVLCGNPLPAPLPLSHIEQTGDTDGYIYVYEKNGFTPYALHSDYILPPFSAFFIKVQRETELFVQTSPPVKSGRRINVSTPLPTEMTEPFSSKSPVSSAYPPFSKDMNSYIKGDRLYLENMPARGCVSILNYKGQNIWQKEIGKGSSSLRLPSLSGLYIVSIQANPYQAQHKCVWSQ